MRKAGELKGSKTVTTNAKNDHSQQHKKFLWQLNSKSGALQLSVRLAKLNEVAEKEEDYLALKHDISAEENAEHLSESELSENKENEREDEEDNMFQKT
ncbi:unnamed protein product [Onchocerca flexuosa]|uniref:Uncharacterized protein n=1 Tax=Onchocerca flexuosa TaxID=387005 RepID=A0A183HG53_9BILA|nr:unnamed protein product [Onchocerca flexuosa]